MSQENVEAVRLSIEAYRRGDWLAATAYLAPDAIWEVGQELPAQGHGRHPRHVAALDQRLAGARDGR